MKTQLFLGNEPRIELFNPVIGRNFIKPHGGLWTSTFIDNKEYSEWVQWCIGENFWTTDNLNTWLLTVSKEAKILEIDSIKDAEKVFDKYGYSYSPIGMMKFLNFEKIAKEYDGLHLTSKGQWETRYGFENTLYGWDVESTCWFRWVFDKVESLGELKK